MWGQDAAAPKAAPPAQRPAPAQQFPFPGDAPESVPAPTDAPADATPAKPAKPDLSPPRSDSVKAGDLGNVVGESSSKDTLIDLTPPDDDAWKHPQSSEALLDAEASSTGHVTEFHSWDPHKAAKSVEVGDFYFKRKNYRAAEDRYREALGYKDNDSTATFRLAVCLEKLERPADARAEYESYLRILPNGPEAGEAQKAIDRLKGTAANAKAK
jgi:tetratricopeptide (TPR) repeat protein